MSKVEQNTVSNKGIILQEATYDNSCNLRKRLYSFVLAKTLSFNSTEGIIRGEWLETNAKKDIATVTASIKLWSQGSPISDVLEEAICLFDGCQRVKFSRIIPF